MKAIVAVTIVGSGGAILELESVFVARGPIIAAGEKQAGSQVFDHDLHTDFCNGSVPGAIAQRTGQHHLGANIQRASRKSTEENREWRDSARHHNSSKKCSRITRTAWMRLPILVVEARSCLVLCRNRSIGGYTVE